MRGFGVLATCVLALFGTVLIGLALTSSDDPAAWLDANTTRVDDRTWTADEPPLTVAIQLEVAVPPQSRYVDATGVSLRYHHRTVVITNGAAEGTSTIYLERRGSSGRRTYVAVRWDGSGGSAEPVSGFGTPGDTSGGSTDPAPVSSTRRGSDFRGGGPGSGK